jgi:hypothetical protein
LGLRNDFRFLALEEEMPHHLETNELMAHHHVVIVVVERFQQLVLYVEMQNQVV